jgi:hypothetical protein
MGAYALARRAAVPTVAARTREEGERQEAYSGVAVDEVRTTAAVEHAGDGRQSVSSALETIAAYLPTEGLALYVTAFAVLAPADDSAGERDRWLIFLFATVLNVFFTVLAMRVTGAAPSTGIGWSRPVFRTALAVAVTSLGLCIYVAALPDNPFLGRQTIPVLNWTWSGMSLPWAGVVAVAVSLVLPVVAAWVGLTSRPED